MGEGEAEGEMVGKGQGAAEMGGGCQGWKRGEG